MSQVFFRLSFVLFHQINFEQMNAGFWYSALVHLERSTICIDSGFGSPRQSPVPVFIQNSYSHFPPYEFS